MMRDIWVNDSLEDAALVCGLEVMDAYRYYWRNSANAFREFRSVDDFQFENVWKYPIINE